jgi:hypothetical protein
MLAGQLMGPVGVVLRGGAFFGLFLRQMTADDTAADRPDHRMMACVVTGYATDNRAFHAAGRVCAAGRCQTECGRNEQRDLVMVFHDPGLLDD